MMGSLIHEKSCESVKSELDLFAVPPTQTSLVHGHYVEHRPMSSLMDGAPVEFCISEKGNYYIDLANSLLYVRASVVTSNGEELAADAQVAPANNSLHSLWFQVDLSLNNVLVTQSANTYPYRAYIETLLSFGPAAANSQLSACLWCKDTANRFDRLDDRSNGYLKRKGLIASSAEVDMLGKLHLDMCFQQRFLLNGVELKLRLIRSKDAFCLMGDGDFKVLLKEVSLFCRKVRPSDAVRLAHIKALLLGMASYPLRRVEVKTFTVPQGNLSWVKENVFLGQFPKRMVVGFVDTAFNGQLNKNQFRFQNYGINFIAIYKDGEQIFSKPLQPDFSRYRFVRSYLSLFTETNQYYVDEWNGITRTDYPHGNTLFAFDFTADLGAASGHWELAEHGSIRLEIHFSQALTATINTIIYAEFDNL